MFTPEVLDPTVDVLAGAVGRWPRARAGDRNRAGRHPPRRPRRPGERHRALPADGRRAPTKAGRPSRSSWVTWPRARCPAHFSLVYVVWNSIGNLRTQAEQVATASATQRATSPRVDGSSSSCGCPASDGSHRARPRCPSTSGSTTSASTPTTWRPSRARPTTTAATPTAPSRTAPATSATSGPPSATSWHSSPGWSSRPAAADWHGHPFTSDSECHVSVWRKPT